jgi:hypothetical protein
MAEFSRFRTYPCAIVAAAVAAFAFVTVGSLLNAAPYPGPGINSGTAPFTVNRFRKGDRLPLFNSNRGVLRDMRMPSGLETQDAVPLGCDLAVSPVTTSSPAKVYGRCVV